MRSPTSSPALWGMREDCFDVKTRKGFMTKFYWHIHHNILLEPAIIAMSKRRQYIKTYKPKHERTRRLKLLKAVKGILPKELMKIGEVYSRKDWTGQDEYNSKLKRFSISIATRIYKLHQKECPRCPWDGNTIFPE